MDGKTVYHGSVHELVDLNLALLLCRVLDSARHIIVDRVKVLGKFIYLVVEILRAGIAPPLHLFLLVLDRFDFNQLYLAVVVIVKFISGFSEVSTGRVLRVFIVFRSSHLTSCLFAVILR